MRPFVYLISGILLCLTASAQKSKDIPSFGNVDKSELQMTECAFDKNADALVLFDLEETVSTISTTTGSFFAETERRVRIKILKQSGAKQADIHIPYWTQSEKIKSLSAQTYNLDAPGNIVVTKVDKKNIYDKQVNKRRSEIVFTFPEVKAGSIIEYKFSNYGSLVNDWYFQRSIPVKLSRFIINFPTELIVTAIPFCTMPLETNKGLEVNSQVQTFTMKDIPGLQDEPYMTSKDDYLQRVEAHISAIDMPGYPRRNLVPSWPEVIKTIMQDEDFGLQLKRNIPRTADLDQQLQNVTEPVKKMKIIHEYVRKNMEWNGYDNIWALDGVRSAWKDKKGTSGEINLILINLLKDANLDVKPILVRQAENGAINMFNPGYRQFDKVLAYVKIGDNDYFLDATEKHTPSTLIPLDVVATEGLVISKLDTYEWGWKTLWDEKDDYKTLSVVSGDIKENGEMEGKAEIIYANYARLEKASGIKAGQEKFIEKTYTSKNTGTTISDFKAENVEDDTMSLKTSFGYKQQLSSSGDYIYFNTNLFTGLEENPFTAENRVSDIVFGANQKYVINASFTIPENYVFDAIPKNIRMIMPDTSIAFSRMAGVQEDLNMISMKILLEFKKPIYPVSNYPEFQEFYKQLFTFLSEQVVIKKK
ncbi:MAG: DUF3857 and transglutaminase domain-containing protein [Sphingobacteriales bacterium]|nr:DUF3857 and transglutaminase domain-containing protein [Sphingobacteriales bacterium]MBI3717907.1 DUF3857 and transglutaminase domain-containing protein [Sphingobacteriales bacterium]